MRGMTPEERQELVAAGFTRAELEAVLNAVQFGLVLAEAGETTDAGIKIGATLSGAKARLLLRIFRDMKAGDDGPDPWGDDTP